MLIAVFTFFIWILTSFQLLIWGIVARVGVILGVFFWSKRKKQSWRRITKLLLKICGIFLVAVAIVLSFWWRENLQMPSDFLSFSFLGPQEQSQQDSSFIKVLSNYQVKGQTKPDRYIVQERPDGADFLLKTEQSLELGGIYHIGASLNIPDRRLTYGGRFFEGTGSFGQKMEEFLSYEFSYEKWMLMKGYQGTLYPQFILMQGKSASRLQTTKTKLKESVLTFFSPKHAGLLLGMMLGDKSVLGDADYKNFVQSGMVHIIAVSGGNLVMIVVFLGAVLFFLPFYVRNVVIIIGVVAFAMLVGDDSSVVRALIMCVLSLLALFRGREIAIWRLMQYAFVLMLCYNPYFLAYDLGFLLSFGALGGIVLLSQWAEFWSRVDGIHYTLIEKKKKLTQDSSYFSKICAKLSAFWLSFWKTYGIPTIGASFGTLPILLFFVGENNLTGILANLLIVPLVPLITIGGFIGLGIASISGWGRVLEPIRWLLDLMFLVSDWTVTYSLVIEVRAMRIKWMIVLLMWILVWVVMMIFQEGNEKK